MDALATTAGWDWRRERAWGGLRALLESHPEGVPGIAALDRLVQYGMPEAEAADLLAMLRDAGIVSVANGRWAMR